MMVTPTIAIIFGVLCALAGGAIFLACFHRQWKKLRQTKSEETNAMKKAETSKKIIWVCLFNGFAWVWCSYILASLDKMQIAESLSQVAVTEIIGVVLVYCLKSAVENLSKHNSWPDKSNSTDEPQG